MNNQYDITVCDGKYRLIMDSSNRFYALRYGEGWRDLCGDGMVLALVQEIDSLQDKVLQLEKELNVS